MSESPVSAVPASRSRWLPGWWLRAPLLLLLALALYIRLDEGFGNDPAMRNVFGFMALALAALLYVLWLILRSGLAGRVRAGIALLLLVTGVFLFTCLEFRGFSGVMVPQFAWVWNPEPEPDALDPATQQEGTDTEPGSLTAGIPFTQYLGPDRNGVIPGAELVGDWSTPPERLWSKQIGEGLAGFVAIADRCILLEQRGDEELVVCYRLADGAVLWSHSEATRHANAMGGVGPRSVPTIHGDRVYVMGATGRLLCLDLAAGAVVWRVDLFALLGTDQTSEEAGVTWGRSGSPLVVDDLLVVPGGGPEGARCSLIAFDRHSGEERWRGGSQQISYASPLLADLVGRQQIITVNEDSVAGHDPQQGQELWRHPFPGRSNRNASGSQPIPFPDGRLLLSKGYGVGGMMFQLSQADGAWQVTELWHRPKNLRTKFSNPVPGVDSVFGLNERFLQSIDPSTGEEIWSGEKYGHGQIIRRGKHILVLTERGAVALVDAATGKELGRIQAVTGKCWSTPCLTDNLLLVRSFEEAACWRLPVVRVEQP